MYLHKAFLVTALITVNFNFSFSQINKGSTFDYAIGYNNLNSNRTVQHLELREIKFKESKAVNFENISLYSHGFWNKDRVEVCVSKYAIRVIGSGIKKTYLEAPYDDIKKARQNNLFPQPNLWILAFKILTYEYDNEIDRYYSSILLKKAFPEVYLYNMEFNTIDIAGDSLTNIEINECSGKFLNLTDLNKDCLVYLNNIKVDTLQFAYLENARNIRFDIVKSNVIILSNIKLDGNISFLGVPLPKILQLDNLSFTNPESRIDLTSFQYSDSSKCQLILGDFDYTKVKLNYQYFNLFFRTDTLGKEFVSNDRKENIYTYLLEEQKRDGFSIGQEKLDKEFKVFKYNRNGSLLGKFANLLDRWWWDYGYNKKLIVLRSMEIMFFFFMINLLLFSKLIYSGYTIKQFIYADQMLTDKYGRQWKRIPFKAFYCLLYTGYIFWGLKIDVEKIKLENIVLAIWIIFQYLTGIICIAWIAYYIVSR